jgi:hypothetical protein
MYLESFIQRTVENESHLERKIFSECLIFSSFQFIQQGTCFCGRLVEGFRPQSGYAPANHCLRRGNLTGQSLLNAWKTFQPLYCSWSAQASSGQLGLCSCQIINGSRSMTKEEIPYGGFGVLIYLYFILLPPA